MNPGCSKSKPKLDETIAKLKAVCRSRGISGVRDLGCALGIYDKCHVGTLTFCEFAKELRNFGLTNCDEEELQQLFNCLDRCECGQILAEDLMDVVRRPMSRWRISIVDRVFAKADQNRDGYATLGDLEAVYDYSKHPKFLNGDWVRDRIVGNFISHFAGYDCNMDVIVSRNEFQDFYAGLSMFIDRNVDFDYIIRHNWKI